MAMYLVSYDLRQERSFEDYVRVYDKLRTAVTFCWPLHSVWIIETTYSPKEIIDILVSTGTVDDNDGLIVCELTGVADWRRVKNKQVADWLNQKLVRR